MTYKEVHYNFFWEPVHLGDAVQVSGVGLYLERSDGGRMLVATIPEMFADEPGLKRAIMAAAAAGVCAMLRRRGGFVWVNRIQDGPPH